VTLKSLLKHIIMVQSTDKRVHEIPDRGSIAEANGVLPDGTGSEASQAFDAISNGNDDIGVYDSFFEALEVVTPNGIDKYYAPSSQ
jgi:hypothetical protein